MFALEDVSVLDFALVGGIAFATAVLGGVSGYGVGLILPIFVAPVVGVTGVIPVMAVAMFFTNFSRVWVYRAHLRLDAWAIVIATGTPSAVLGAWIYVQLPARWIAAAIGGFLIVALILRRVLQRHRFAIGRPGLALVGVVYGTISGGMTGAGLILIAFLLAAGIEGAALIVTDAAVSVVFNLVKIVVFGTTATMTVPLFLAGCLIGLCTVPGTFVAGWIMERVALRVHVLMIEAIVAFGGVWFLAQAVL